MGTTLVTDGAGFIGSHLVDRLLAREDTVVAISSSSVYGANARVPFREDDDTNSPLSPYAATKRAGELICHTYHSLYDMPITCLRYFTAYGPRGRPDMAAYLFTRSVIEGQPIRMFGDGSTVRDYTYVGDIADGTIAALDAELPFEIINLGNSEEIPLAEFIRVVERVTGKTAIIEKAPMQAGDMPRTCADISKALRLLGYNPSISIDEGMRSFVDWYQTEARCIERSLDEGHSAHSNISNRSGP